MANIIYIKILTIPFGFYTMLSSRGVVSPVLWHSHLFFYPFSHSPWSKLPPYTFIKQKIGKKQHELSIFFPTCTCLYKTNWLSYNNCIILALRDRININTIDNLALPHSLGASLACCVPGLINKQLREVLAGTQDRKILRNLTGKTKTIPGDKYRTVMF